MFRKVLPVFFFPCNPDFLSLLLRKRAFNQTNTDDTRSGEWFKEADPIKQVPVDLR